MDRPEDKFCWDNAEKLSGECSRWKCKHCEKDFSGACSSIRNHLSGEGYDIQPCEAVPKEIQEEAFNRSPMKKARCEPSSSSKGSEEIIADKLMEFLISRNVSVDTIKNSHFMTFLTMVAQHGSVPWWLLHDDSVVIRRSLLNYEDVVNQHIREVKESWKTTGFTYMFYNLNELQEKIISNAHDQDNLVIGWYSPKGFFFTQGRRFAKLYNESSEETDRKLSLPMCDAVQYIDHPCDVRSCHYQAWDLTDYYGGIGVGSVWCVENRIQLFCNGIYEKSEWVRDVIDKSKQLYTYMKMYSKSPSKIWIQKQFEKVENGAYESSFTHLISNMKLKEELEEWRSIALEEEKGPWSEEINYIIDDNEFWCDGKELQLAIGPILEIYELVDSLQPTAGYLLAVVNEAKCNLKSYYDAKISMYDKIWECFEGYFGYYGDWMEDAPAYLSPPYIRSNEANFNLSDAGKRALKRFVETEEVEALDAELEAYSIRSSNPFANLSFPEYEFTDRIKLWEKYGGDRFPLLKRCANKLLSQPVSCMCNQVKKHMSQIQGSEDNFILRLNYKMMAEFKNPERTGKRY